VESDRYSPKCRLKEILKNTAIPIASPEFSPLDALYLSVLMAASRSNSTTTEVDPTLCSRLRNLIGAVVLVEQPLSIPALAQLMGVPEDKVDRDVRALSAVLLVGPEKDSDDTPVVRALHLSFRDFLLSRCNDRRFRIQEFAQHHDLALNCLTTLNSTLKQNMCNILNPTVSNFELKEPPLTVCLRKSIPSTACYAGQHWMVHTSQASTPSTVLLAAMRAFVRQHLFHWIELLSLIAQVPYAIQHLPAAIAWWMVSIHYHSAYVLMITID
jgi:hypothetical protein